MTTVSQSRIKLWRRCHKAHDYAWNQHLRKKAPPAPMLRGTILHELIDAKVNGEEYEPIFEKYQKKYAELFWEEQEIYGTLLDDIRKIFGAYCRTYENDGLEYLHTELELSIDLREDIEFVVHIDKVVRDNHKRLWIKDHKSHKNIPGPEQRLADLQLILYGWIWNQTQPEPVTGVVWDYIRAKPPTEPEVLKNGGLSKAKSINTDHFTYMAAIKKHGLNPKDYAEILTHIRETSEGKFFDRVWLPISRSMQENIVADLRSTATEIHVLGETLKDRNLTRDCSFCQFYHLCQAELRGQDVNFVKKTQYIEEAPRGYVEEE